MIQKQKQFLFLILFLFFISIPILEFLNFNSYSINYLQFKNILLAYFFFLTLFIIIGVATSYFINKNLNLNLNFFIKIIVSFYIFFNYTKIKNSFIKLKKYTFTENFTYFGEISLLIILLLIFFLFKYTTLNFSYNFFILLKKPQFLASTNKSTLNKNEDTALFNPKNNKEIKTNIYYVIPDQAIDLKEYSENLKAIDYKQIKKDFLTKGFKYLDDVESQLQ